MLRSAALADAAIIVALAIVLFGPARQSTLFEVVAAWARSLDGIALGELLAAALLAPVALATFALRRWGELRQALRTALDADAARAHSAAIVQSSRVAIASTSLDGRVQSWNPAAEAIYGYTAAEMRGQPITLCLAPPEIAPRAPEQLAGRPPRELAEPYQTRAVCKDRRHLDVAVHVSPVRDAAGRVTGLAWISHDVTASQRHAAARQAAREQAACLEGVMLAAREMGHLLLNDLQPPVTNLELMQDHADLPASVRPHIAEALEWLASAEHHVRQFQQVTRVATKETPVGRSLDLECAVQPPPGPGSPADADRRAA